MSFLPSTHQAAIIHFVRNSRGNAVVNAVAGSGKSTLLRQICEAVSAEPNLTVGTFAFNNEAKASLVGKLRHLPAVTVQTTYALGLGAVSAASYPARVKVDADKYRTLAKPHLAEFARGHWGQAQFSPALRAALADGGSQALYAATFKLCDLARLDLLAAPTDAELTGLSDLHELDYPAAIQPLLFDLVRELIAHGLTETTWIDFTDMVSLPGLLGLAPKQFDLVLVDECQDLNRAQLALMRSAVKPGGRSIFVGDPQQAIYGFAGADANSFQAIIDQTEATVFPLSVCYRCPTAVVAKAQTLCPLIEAAPSAAAGVLADVPAENFATMVETGDMVLCRVNAPLLGMAFELIARGIKAVVRGRDIGKGLQKVVTEAASLLCGRDFTEHFGQALNEWREHNYIRAARKGGSEEQIAARRDRLDDQANCVLAVYGRVAHPTSAAAVNSAIESLFACTDPAVTLSSIHRAKGLEAPRVFIAQPEKLECPRATSAWQLTQESNLFYVAVTRAQSALFMLR